MIIFVFFVSESFIAIPETINSTSISVVGEWDRFNVTWDPATRVNVNNSRVYYDVSLHFSGQYKIEVSYLDNHVGEYQQRALFFNFGRGIFSLVFVLNKDLGA